MNIKNKSFKIALMMITPFLIGLLIFYIIPLCISFYFSLTSGIGKLEFVGLKNFIELFKNDAYILASKNTFIFMIMAIPLNIIISLIIALLLNSKLKNISFFRTISILPLVIPVSAVILTWQIFLDYYGIINNILYKFNINQIDWINSKYSLAVIILMYLWKNCAYNIIIFLVGLNNIPTSYYEAAKIDGCGNFRSFMNITIPLLKSSTLFVLIISISNSFKVYRETYLLAGEYPNESIYMLQNFMVNNFNNLNYQRLSSAAFIIFFIISLIVFVFYRNNKAHEIEY